MTRVISLSGLGNTGKSTLINGLYEGEEKIRDGIVEVLQNQGLTVKVYPEIARTCYSILDNPDTPEHLRIYEFQKTIHNLETIRIQQCIEDKRKGLYDVMIFDRTRFDNILYSLQNYYKGKIPQIDYFEDDPDPYFYDSVILLSQPIKDSMKKEFDIYGGKEFKKKFQNGIENYYGFNVATFKNSLIDRDNIIDYILRTL